MNAPKPRRGHSWRPLMMQRDKIILRKWGSCSCVFARSRLSTSSLGIQSKSEFVSLPSSPYWYTVEPCWTRCRKTRLPVMQPVEWRIIRHPLSLRLFSGPRQGGGALSSGQATHRNLNPPPSLCSLPAALITRWPRGVGVGWPAAARLVP